jgi:DNA-binding Xre family transcriptional regulator
MRIKEVATERKMSISTLSHKTYLSMTTIRHLYQHPYSSTTLDTLQKLANALECSVFDLLEEVPD